MLGSSCSQCCSESPCYPPLEAQVRISFDWYGASTALGITGGHIGNNLQNRLRGNCFFAVPPYYGTGTSDRFRDNQFFTAISEVSLSMPPPAAWPAPPPFFTGWELGYQVLDSTPRGLNPNCDVSLYQPWRNANGLLSRNGLTPIGCSVTRQSLSVHLLPFTYPGIPQPADLIASGAFPQAMFQQEGIRVCGLAWCGYLFEQGLTFSNSETDIFLVGSGSRGKAAPRNGVSTPIWPDGPFKFDYEAFQSVEIDKTQYVAWGVTANQSLWTSGAFELEYEFTGGLDAYPWTQVVVRLGGTVEVL